MVAGPHRFIEPMPAQTPEQGSPTAAVRLQSGMLLDRTNSAHLFADKFRVCCDSLPELSMWVGQNGKRRRGRVSAISRRAPRRFAAGPTDCENLCGARSFIDALVSPSTLPGSWSGELLSPHNLPSDLPAREVPGAGIVGLHTVAGVDVHVRHPRLQQVHQALEVYPRER